MNPTFIYFIIRPLNEYLIDFFLFFNKLFFPSDTPYELLI